MKGSILIAGPAGYGLNTFNDMLSKILKAQGHYVFSNKDYMSRVRGGFNFTKIRFAEEELFSFDPKLDYLIALDRQGVSKLEDLRGTGCLIGTNLIETKDQRAFLLDEKHIKATFGKWTFSMATLGALLWDLGLDLSVLDGLSFGKWPEHVVQANKDAITYGYQQKKLADPSNENRDNRQSLLENKESLMVSGNQAIALGAAAGGLDFYCAYPMAPSTGVMTYINKYSKEMNIIVEQAEDEIAAINAAIGASSTGVRAMTGSSGGGYALMVEALGFAAIGEVPLVVVNVERPGPATGLPTRTEQADLSFVLYASQGEFSRMIVAPRSVEDAFYQTFRALNIADKYNMPVTILSDEYLADTVSTIPKFNLDGLKIERHIETNFNDYKRYNFDHVSGHRAYPGLNDETLIMTDSHVHHEDGSISEDPEVTIHLKHKLMAKQEALKDEVLEPLYIGVEEPNLLITSWGSTYGAIKEAVETLMAEGHSIGMLSFNDIFPLPTKRLNHYAGRAKKIVNIEQNYTNQFGKVLILEGNVRYDAAINKYDGRPFSSHDIVSALEVHLNE
jgi:2-oxoglutarate ferredoxin oxidoreductase subunit alpha